MVFKAFYDIWHRRSSRLEREQKLAQERLRQRQTQEDKERAERQETADLVIAVLVSEDYGRFYEELSNDLKDAKAAARMAYERVAAEEQQAAEALARVQENALVLADGRRVYFTADDSVLYGEDLQLVTDAALLNEARRLRRQSPTTSTFEEFDSANQALAQAAEEQQQLADILEKLDELEQRVQGGELNPDELAQARIELDEIVASLPEGAREAYEQLQADRARSEVSYRAADEVFSGVPVRLRSRLRPEARRDL